MVREFKKYVMRDNIILTLTNELSASKNKTT